MNTKMSVRKRVPNKDNMSSGTWEGFAKEGDLRKPWMTGMGKVMDHEERQKTNSLLDINCTCLRQDVGMQPSNLIEQWWITMPYIVLKTDNIIKEKPLHF